MRVAIFILILLGGVSSVLTLKDYSVASENIDKVDAVP